MVYTSLEKRNAYYKNLYENKQFTVKKTTNKKGEPSLQAVFPNGKPLGQPIKLDAPAHKLVAKLFPNRFPVPEGYTYVTGKQRLVPVSKANVTYTFSAQDWRKYGFETRKDGEKFVQDLKNSGVYIKSVGDLQREEYFRGLRQAYTAIEPEYRRTIRRHPFLHFNKLKDYISWYVKKNGINGKFRIKLKSGQADVTHPFKFNHPIHFEHWFDKVIQDHAIVSSDSFSEKHEIELGEFRNLFGDYVHVLEIKSISGGCNKHKGGEKKMKSSFYKYRLFNPTSRDNNCFIKCLSHILNTELKASDVRKQYQLQANTEITVDDAYRILAGFDRSDIEIIDYDTNEELEDDKTYIVLKDNHYYVLLDFEEVNRKDHKTKRGLLTFDFETRPTEEYSVIKATNQRMYVLKDTICDVYYRRYKEKECQGFNLTTNSEKSSARQFIDWLNEEAKSNKSYNILAHNGGRFDFYFIVSCMTDRELIECDIQMRGTTIIGINYRGNLFKDSCCFLTDSLSNLSKAFKVSQGKITELELHGEKITSTQLCFYKPELTFSEFMQLESTDTDFWVLYEKYCLHDCIALFQIWEKFTQCVNTLIEKVNPYLLRSCPLMSANTIGSHSKKILVELNEFKGQANYYKQDLDKFTGISYEKVRNDKPMSEKQEWAVKHGQLDESLFYRHEKVIDREKYDFICKFKRGGISHCHKAGKHLSGITGVDIASQYPASLIYSHIPTGKSFWLNDAKEFNPDFHGFYHLTGLKFESRHTLKPVASYTAGESLKWDSKEIKELYVDSYTIEYLQKHYGLKSFHIEKALVSYKHVEGKKIFGKFIETFYEEKKQQDAYKSSGDPNYNEALRSTIKLYLNSLTGKLVENPALHFSMKLEEKNDTTTKVLNGVGVAQEFQTDKINEWVVAGAMVYSYSKRLLFEYIRCLPNDSSDVIHIETDGIYFSTRDLEKFSENLNNYDGEYPCKFGEDLGNLKIEKTTREGQVAYFLGKKFYCITLNNEYNTKPRDAGDKNIYRIKGIPQKTIEDDGSPKYLVDVKLYEDVYAGKQVHRSFQTMKKCLFTEKTSISTYTMTRLIKPNCEYKLYE